MNTTYEDKVMQDMADNMAMEQEEKAEQLDNEQIVLDMFIANATAYNTYMLNKEKIADLRLETRQAEVAAGQKTIATLTDCPVDSETLTVLANRAGIKKAYMRRHVQLVPDQSEAVVNDVITQINGIIIKKKPAAPRKTKQQCITEALTERDKQWVDKLKKAGFTTEDIENLSK